MNIRGFQREKETDGRETVIQQIKKEISLVWRNTWVCKLE